MPRRIAGPDRVGLERLLRYCAPPPFALERLNQVADNQIVYRIPRSQPDGRRQLRRTPLERIDALAALTAHLFAPRLSLPVEPPKPGRVTELPEVGGLHILHAYRCCAFAMRP
jgi:hypothetical protein